MSLSSKAEQGLLSHDDWAVVKQTHHPAIFGLSRSELEDLRERLRDLRGKERTAHRQIVRAGRGKAEPRAASPGNADHRLKRKQVFAGALKRVNSEVSRLRKLESKRALTASAQRALALRRAAGSPNRPDNDPTANPGMRSKPNTRGRSHVPGSQVGSVSQATKNAQARRDNG